MPKQKVRQSVETATADKAIEPAPALCDDMPDDFMAFVRLALNDVNAKLDSIVTLQSSSNMYQNYMNDLSQFVLVLGQFVTLLLWTICHKSYLSQFYFGRFVTSHICPRRCLKKRIVIWGDT